MTTMQKEWRRRLTSPQCVGGCCYYWVRMILNRDRERKGRNKLSYYYSLEQEIENDGHEQISYRFLSSPSQIDDDWIESQWWTVGAETAQSHVHRCCSWLHQFVCSNNDWTMICLIDNRRWNFRPSNNQRVPHKWNSDDEDCCYSDSEGFVNVVEDRSSSSNVWEGWHQHDD